MKILVLAPQWPDPPRQGAAIRNLHILLYMARRHDVYLLTFACDGDMQMQRLERVCKYIAVLPVPARSYVTRLNQLATSSVPDMAWRLHSDAMQKRIGELSSDVQFDAIHIEGIEMAPYALQIQEQHPEIRSRLTYDAHNAEYLLQRRAYKTDIGHPDRLPRAFYSLVQWRRLSAFEQHVCRLSNSVLAVSERDKAALSKLVPDKSDAIQVLPNGVDPLYWSREADYPPVDLHEGVDALVFDGTMDFRPNGDAVLWFANKVWPLIRADRPNASFYIVGRNPPPSVVALGMRSGITVTGAVADTRGWVAGSTVYVVPMRMGGGVRLKVLQAMAMGCAIVSTPMGADGISARHGTDLLLARSPADFAAATLSLLSDAGLRSRLGGAAHERVAAMYAWDKLLPVLDELYPGAAPKRVQTTSNAQRIPAPLPPLEAYLPDEMSAGQEADVQSDIASQSPPQEDACFEGTVPNMAADVEAGYQSMPQNVSPMRDSVVETSFSDAPVDTEAEAYLFEQFRATSSWSAVFDNLLESWSAFVLSVEKGYGSTLFEYSKGLEKRDQIGDMLPELPDSVVDKLIPMLRPWDRRFKDATQEVMHPVLGYANTDKGVWWYRVPRVLKNNDYPKITFWRRDYPYTRVSSDTWQLDTSSKD